MQLFNSEDLRRDPAAKRWVAWSESQHPTICCSLCAILLHVFEASRCAAQSHPPTLHTAEDSCRFKTLTVTSNWSTRVCDAFFVGCTLVRHARRPGTSQLTPKWTDCSGPGPVSSSIHADRTHLPRMNDRFACACRIFTWTMTSGNHTSMFCILCCELLAT